jgi:hypothetical protein
VLRFADVLRKILVLLCAAVLIQETDLGSLVVGAGCLEECADDFVPGHCSPLCAICTCGTQANPMAPRVTHLPAPAALKSCDAAEAALSPGDMHLPDILHVPKRLVA